MNAIDLLQRYAVAQRNFSGAVLHQVDLQSTNLQLMAFWQADLTAANLSQAILEEVIYEKRFSLEYALAMLICGLLIYNRQI